MKTPLEIVEEATAQVAQNLFNIKYPDRNIMDYPKLMEECIGDTVFIINNFMRISADIAAKDTEDEDN